MKSMTLEDVLRLPVSERLRIVEAIWDSIVDAPEGVALTDEQRVELDRRLEAFESNPDAGSSWDEVRARIWPSK